VTGEKDKTPVYLTDEEATLFQWVWANYDVFVSLKEAAVRNGSVTIHYDPHGTPMNIVTNVTIYRRKVDRP